MLIELNDPVFYAFDDGHSRCPKCGCLMGLTRRESSADLGLSYERQTCACECGFEAVGGAGARTPVVIAA